MNSINVISIDELDVKNILVLPVKEKYSRKGVCIKYKNFQDDLFIQLPVVESPFGINYFKDQPEKVYLDVSIQSEKTIKKFMEIDEYIKQIALKNQDEWFNESLNIEYSHSIYQNKKNQTSIVYPPTFRLKFVKNFDESTMVFETNENGNLVTVTDFSKFHKKVNVVPIVKCIGLWILKDHISNKYKYGLDWRLFQIKIVNERKELKCLIQDDDEENSNSENETFYNSD